MIIKALLSLKPGAEWHCGETYSSLEWLSDDITKPTESELNTEIAKLQAEYDAQEYARNRAAAYDSVGNQLDMLMKDMKNNTTTHQESCEAVKAKFPKS